MARAQIWNLIADLPLRRQALVALHDLSIAAVERINGTNAPAAALTDSLVSIRSIHLEYPKLPVIFITASSSEQLAIDALCHGYKGYVRQACLDGDLLQAVRACGVEGDSGGADMSASQECDTLAGGSPSMRSLRAYIRRVAVSPSNVLITGETGTGKEMVAELIHRNSVRQARQMISVNCAALPDSLIESELFGHERGAFTGAIMARDGKLKAADGGTVFFDEIGDMSPFAQAKILRAIEARKVQRLGGNRDVSIDIRIIAATNRNLEALAAEDKFRKDLFYRLCVARIELSPLRERREDIPELVDRFIAEMNVRFGRKVRSASREFLALMFSHDWPGNIRELRNVVEGAFINLPEEPVYVLELPNAVARAAEAEPALLLRTLTEMSWNKSKAARALNWSRMTLYRKMVKYQITPFVGTARSKGAGVV